MDSPTAYLELYDFRLKVAELYRARNAAWQRGDDPVAVLGRFQTGRDALFRDHPQSALDAQQKVLFRGLDHFRYNPAASVEAVIEPDSEPSRLEAQTSGEPSMPMSRVGTVHFAFDGQRLHLALYWIEVYGGGLFLPFHDRTAPDETYGGGRYVFDTIKGSDFISLAGEPAGRRILLDFNYAYNPSCAYDARWACPLAPPENRLPVAIHAGERRFVPAEDAE